ncbi:MULTISPECIES: MFS transporter [unclassified Mycoplasma]|uniref:MFS transporter n=1 Tax=unclassified Mycoplasma TaxID=2683645 RepID=UPI00211CF79F|nr:MULTISPECIES: MFS transporter [unclassified Mycoplasma]UUM19598.1 MFS transporter [Mycoplasma sp. 1578d]UUM24518.1 MFS transporter [Mycoplasma sp. 3686d]
MFKKLTAKITSKGFTTNQIFALIILAAADVFVIAAPYYIKNIVPNLHLYLGVREDDVAKITAVIGWVTLATQLPGGFLANKFPSRWLLFIAVLSTGLIGFWFGITVLEQQSFERDALVNTYKAIWGLWGISSTLIFWTPLWKLVSQQGKKENQAFAYGIQGTANGFIGLFFVYVIGVIVTYVWIPAVSKNDKTPFAVYSFLLSAFLVAVSFMVLFFVKEKYEKSTEKITFANLEQKLKTNVISIFKAMGNWKLWAMSIFVMGSYIFQSVLAYYIINMMENVFIAPVILVSILAGLRTYGLRMLVSGFVGRFADKFKSYVLLLIFALAVGMGTLIVFTILPSFGGDFKETSALKVIFLIILSLCFVLGGIVTWTIVTLRFTQISEVHIEKKAYASSIGLISFIAFSPDAWFYELSGYIGSIYTPERATNTSVTGYQIIILITIGFAFVGLIAGLIVFLSNRAELKRLGKTDYRWRDLHND